MEADPSLLWVLVNLFFAFLALAIGFLSGAFVFGGNGSRKNQHEQKQKDEALEKRIALERALLATGQLHDIASGVAIDVGAHSRRVEEISNDLKAAESADGVISESTVAQAVTKILHANEVLQTRLEKAEKQIKAQALEIAVHESEARTDSLTGLSNRRAFDDELQRRLSEWQRNGAPFSLVILDVDHFKKFNDTHGHQAGDEVLREVSKAIKDSTRDMDIPCRYGGEEFAVVLPSACLEDAASLAERVRESIAARTISHDGKTLSVTASLGVAQVQEPDDAKLILRRADEALYEAKGAGRNRSYVNEQGGNRPVLDTTDPTGSNAASKLDIPLRVLDQLPNRTAFVHHLSKRIAESQRTAQSLSVLAMEIESYPRLKDDYSESVAALTLDSVAQFLLKTLREMDSLARVDEGRFAVLLPGADEKTAQKVAERANTALVNCALPIGEENLQLDTKMSLAAFQPSDSAADLLGRAEEALLKAVTDGAPVQAR